MKKAIVAFLALMLAIPAFGENRFSAILVFQSHSNITQVGDGYATYAEWATEVVESTGEPFSEGDRLESRCLVFGNSQDDFIGGHSVCKHFHPDGDTFNTQLEADEFAAAHSVNVISGTGEFRGVLASCLSRTVLSDHGRDLAYFECTWVNAGDAGHDAKDPGTEQ